MEENRHWRAKWIWRQGYPWTEQAGEHELVCFRREFEVTNPERAKLVVDVTADSRYRLFLNGQSVSVGPCKGDAFTHYYETVDLSGRLAQGKNVLAVQVLHLAASGPHVMGTGGPISVHRSAGGGLLLEGALVEGSVEMALHTDEQWRCKRMSGFRLVPSRLIPWLGGCEDTDGANLDHFWQLRGFPDTGWSRAVVVCDTSNDFGELTPWQLAPRPIPPLYEREGRFSNVTKSSLPDMGGSEFRDGSDVPGTIRVEPQETVWLELDADELRTGYLRLELVGGKGGVIRILCAECYENPASQPYHRIKGRRDDAENGILIGEADRYTAAGCGSPEQPEAYEPFWFRTFRYVRLEITAGEEPLEVARFSYRDTGYPLNVQASFECSDPDYTRLWQLALNTLQRCMHETYEDCPYYEQLQYTMDTRLQMQFTYNVSADDRLARRTLFDYYSSALPSGMLQCRYPSVYRQVIPSFSLYWIQMLKEHFLHFGDADLLRRYRPAIDALLGWFRRRLTAEGLIGTTPRAYWPFIDWVEQWDNGIPSDASAGKPATVLSMMVAHALVTAADLYEATGWYDAAREARAQASSINEAIVLHCWRPSAALFADGPDEDAGFSQHAQVWGVACGAITGKDSQDLLRRTLADPSLPQLSVPMSYVLFRVLDTSGQYELAAPLLDGWKAFLSLGLTTLPEWAFGNPRSDCHAWSALPLSEFTGQLLGVRPGAPGYGEIRIVPHTLHLSWASGKVATRHGTVNVSWRMETDGDFHISVHSPEGVPVVVELPNGEQVTNPDGGSFEASCRTGVVSS